LGEKTLKLKNGFAKKKSLERELCNRIALIYYLIKFYSDIEVIFRYLRKRIVILFLFVWIFLIVAIVVSMIPLFLQLECIFSNNFIV
jgi:hypothetical protein